MEENELQALIDQTVTAKVTEAEAAVKAKLDADAQQAQAKTEGDGQGAGEQAKDASATTQDAAKSEPITREQFESAVKTATEAAVKATVAKFEPMLVAARRPSFGAGTMMKQRKVDPMPLYWAVKAAKAAPGGALRFNLAYSGKEQELEFDGTAEAVKAFKAMLTTAGSATGEHFVPEVQTALVVEALYQAIISRELPGVVIYPMTSKIENAPTIGAFTAGWATEGSALTSAGDATTAQKQLIAKDLTAIARLSNNLLVDSNPSVEQYVRNGLAGAIGEAYDTGVWYGGGGTAPTGITGTVGVTSTALSTDDIYTAIVKAVGRMAANKVSAKNVAVVMHPLAATKAITTRASTSGDFLGSSGAVGVPMVNTNGKDPLGDAVARRTGFHTRTMSTIPVASDASNINVLAAENLVLGDRQELEIASSNVAGAAFENNLTYIRAILRGDVFLMRAAALEIITGVAH